MSRTVIVARGGRGAPGRRKDRSPHRRVSGFRGARTYCYGAGWPRCSPSSWHTCRTGTPPGWPQHGCRRPPRTGLTARSHRPATRRPPRAGPARSRRAELPRPAPRTGACGSAGRAGQPWAGTARAVPPVATGRPGWPRTTPARRRQCRGIPRGEGIVPRMQDGKVVRQLEEVSVAGEPVEQETAGGCSIFGGRPFPGRHGTTVRQAGQVPQPGRWTPSAGGLHDVPEPPICTADQSSLWPSVLRPNGLFWM
jgi:hypothetical protein